MSLNDIAKGCLVCSSPQAPGWVIVSICIPRRYVIECPNCGVVYRSRQYWFGNQDPVDTVVRTEIVHVWPGVRAALFILLSPASFGYSCVWERETCLELRLTMSFICWWLRKDDLESLSYLGCYFHSFCINIRSTILTKCKIDV